MPYPVVVDTELEIWEDYGNLGWPARYLFDEDGMLFEHHYGEGGYAETELAIQELLGIDEPLLEPVRPEDDPGVLVEAQSEDVEGAYSGPYRAGAVWAVLDGAGTVTANGRELQVDRPGCYELVAHPRQHRGRARAGRRRRRPLPRGLLHAGSSRLTSAGGPSSSSTTANPGR